MEKLDYEIQILKKTYSNLRRRQNKWKFRGVIEVDQMYLINEESYSQQDLIQRRALKRKPKLLKAAYDLWLLLNPFHNSGLSKNIFYNFLIFTYKYLFKLAISPAMLESFAANDTELDFEQENCLYFCNFYDSIFDIADQFTTSKSLTEYVSCISNLTQEIRDLKVLELLNLHNRSHCIGKKPRYYFWMKDTLHITDDLRQASLNSSRSLPKLTSLKVDYIDKMSPLSTFKKSGYLKSSLLEEIIEGRNKYLKANRKAKNRKIKL